MFYRNPSADMLLQEDELDLDLIRKVKPKLQLMLVKLKHNVVKENQTSIEQIIPLLSVTLLHFSQLLKITSSTGSLWVFLNIMTKCT